MKRNILFALCMLMSSICIAQSLPTLEKGSSFQFPLDKKGKKHLDFYLKDIQYSDSTERSCFALYTFRVTSIGIGTAMGDFQKMPKKTIVIKNPYVLKYTGISWEKPIEMLSQSNIIIPQDSSTLIQYKFELWGQKAEFYVNAQKVANINIKYDNTIALQKLAEKKRKLWTEEKFASISQNLSVNIAEQRSCGVDTLFLYSSKVTPFDTDISQYYIINSKKMMVVCSEEELHYIDTFYFDNMSEYLLEIYNIEAEKMQRLTKLRSKKVTEIDAREVFDYFPRRMDIVEFTKQMGNKQLAVTPCCYETTFYDKYEKKNVLFQFTFSDSGKLTSIKRESTNTMPTNDVWSAFMLQETVETFRDLGKALEILKKDKKNTSSKK